MKLIGILSLTPGFSPVLAGCEWENCFNGFLAAGKPLKRLLAFNAIATRLKPGVNESSCVNSLS